MRRYIKWRRINERGGGNGKGFDKLKVSIILTTLRLIREYLNLQRQ